MNKRTFAALSAAGLLALAGCSAQPPAQEAPASASTAAAAPTSSEATTPAPERGDAAAFTRQVQRAWPGVPEAARDELAVTICDRLSGADTDVARTHEAIVTQWEGYDEQTARRLVKASVTYACPQVAPKLAQEFAETTDAEMDAPATVIPEGTWIVGEDVAAGQYRTRPVEGSCYWGIYAAGSNQDDIVANDIVSGGRATVTLDEGQEFENSGCGQFAKIE